MAIEIRLDGDRVLVCHDGRGRYDALDRDGVVEEVYTPRGDVVWTGGWDGDEERAVKAPTPGQGKLPAVSA